MNALSLRSAEIEELLNGAEVFRPIKDSSHGVSWQSHPKRLTASLHEQE